MRLRAAPGSWTAPAGPNATPESLRRRVIELHRGAGFISHVSSVPASTAQRILVVEGLSRLDRSTGPPPEPLRYARETPSELAHVDVKKLAAIPDDGSWKAHGRGNAKARQRVGYRYIHSAIDDRAQLDCSKIHTNETSQTAAGF